MMKLREWRRRKMWSIADLAKNAGVSNKTISDIENGKVSPKFRTIRRVVGALEVGPDDVAEFAAQRPDHAAPDRDRTGEEGAG